MFQLQLLQGLKPDMDLIDFMARLKVVPWLQSIRDRERNGFSPQPLKRKAEKQILRLTTPKL
jgi:hypothetical protein